MGCDHVAAGGRPIVGSPACPVAAAFGYDGAAHIDDLDQQGGGAGGGDGVGAAAAAVDDDDGVDGGSGVDASPAVADSNVGSFGSCHRAACAVAVADEVGRDTAAAVAGAVVAAVDAGDVEPFHPSCTEKSEAKVKTESLIGIYDCKVVVPVEWNYDLLSFSLLQ